MTTRTAYDRALSLDRGSTGAFALLAVIAHLGVGSVLARHARAASVEPPAVATEVEFIAPPEPPPPPSQPKEEPREDRVAPSAAPVAAAPAKAAPARPSAPAKAGAVMTAAPGTDGPVSFVTDPNGGEYGQGTVAVNGAGTGGSAAHGTGETPAPTPPAPRPSAPPPPPPKKLATPPRLAEANACQGFFPGNAEDDAAVVAISVTVDASGKTTTANVVSESPKGQGFGAAARACVLSRRFVPATGEDGAPTSAAATVNVRFSR